ncbi:MAG: transglutaminase family protein [Burkholderiaceae bacterium]
MAIHVALTHVTDYRYDRLVTLGPQVIRLRPAPHCRTPILSYSLSVSPTQHFINWQQDPFANYMARLVFPDLTDHFRVTVDLVAEMAVYNPFDFFLEEWAENFPFKYDETLARELAPYLVRIDPTPLFAAFVASVASRKGIKERTIDFLVRINQRLQNDIRYLIRMEPGVQTPEETLVSAAGSCRDSGWLLVQALRHLGLAARFVSGYLIQLRPDVKSLDGPSGAETDFTDLHAWCEVYLPGAGWIGLDPTSGLLAGEGHIPLAATPEPGSAAPVSGIVSPSNVEFRHTMFVTRTFESPRVTLPYTPSQWSAIDALGHEVDRQLEAMDVRLTQGGEPTFVAIENRDAGEWNTDALGPTKRDYALRLLPKLIGRYGANGFMHFGQGKWYPGEPLPRWALSALWRIDGEPCVADTKVFDEDLMDENGGAREKARAAKDWTIDDAARLIAGIAQTFGLSPDYAIPAYEDAFQDTWRHDRLPVNSAIADVPSASEKKQAAAAQAARQPVGFVLPLARAEDLTFPVGGARSGWITSRWPLRGPAMLLTPGESSMGYRLPLDTLPWVDPKEYPYLVPGDPSEHRGPLTSFSNLQSGVIRKPLTIKGAADLVAPKAPVDPALVAIGKSASWIVRTALCVELRGGRLRVFMPPVADVERYLELIAGIEAAAVPLGLSIVLEGYLPPRDPRVKMLQVTPDPGVIEVNIQPASSWRELVDHTEFLYQAAHETRLSTEKFMVDGKHMGTGGGNHFVMGGATPADSPFLRNPRLLTSLIGYWHNHPSLSYLFSGMFIGPTSQAPRVDEARDDQLYELEIAFAEVARQVAEPKASDDDVDGIADRAKVIVPGEVEPYATPWMVDRALRNILSDVTGNTHRSEFCIDKLYSPEGPTGRLGLLELRAFEMPPHAQMSLAQQLLLRAMVARFWKQPYGAPLMRWGTGLHDRFMLSTFVRADFETVMAELAEAGYPLEASWFAPHVEFRFPLAGEFSAAGVHMTLRAALEPWHVLAEQTVNGATARYVDSSVERLEIIVEGLTDPRLAIAVNGRALPLTPTARSGEFVAGVRYRAWSPPSALHPTLGVDAPLVIDIVDTTSEKSVGGCRYHVAHPGGRNYDTFPVNAYEAESRRLARFFKIGHTPGHFVIKPTTPSPEYPVTLDLRRR